MKFKMSFGWVKSIILAVVVAACVAVFIVDILLIVGTDTLQTANPAIAGVSMAAALLIIVAACLLLFNSYYRFDEDVLRFMLCIFVDKVPYDAIEAIKQNTENKEIILTIVNDGNGSKEDVRLNLAAAKCDAFLETLKEKCPNVVIELFTPPAKEKKD